MPAPRTSPKKRPAEKPRTRRMGRPSGDFSAHAQILTGASQAFAAKGFAECSVEDILEAAGVSRRTFYRFFRNKEEVFEALFDLSAKVLLNTVHDAVAAEATPEAKLAAAIGAVLAVQADAGPLSRVLLLEPHHAGTRLAARRQEIIDSFMALFQREAQRDVDPLVVRGLVAAMEQITLSLQADARGKPDVERGKRAMLRIAGATLGFEQTPPLPLAPKR